MEEAKAQLIELTRGSTHDGPGMRTTVFLKGCSLACLWCQNPEGMQSQQDIWWERRKCIRCYSCIGACTVGALTEDEGGICRNRQKCTLCGLCVEACPSVAWSFTGQEWEMDALVKEVLKDREYYRSFGGGVTVSGGEPLSQYRFVAEFFRRLENAGIHTALDTCGMAPASSLEAVLPHTAHVLFDLKILDSEIHKALTGQTNALILENLEIVADAVRKANHEKLQGEKGRKGLWIRTPLIPGATASRENIGAISRFLLSHYADVVARWELCAFNNACCSKYEKMGLKWTYESEALMERKTVESLKAVALSEGMPGHVLVVSGLSSGRDEQHCHIGRSSGRER